MKYIGVGLAVILLFLLGLWLALQKPAAAPDSSKIADALFYNGRIVTMARTRSGAVRMAPALAVKNGRIIKIGLLEGMKKLTGAHTQKIDLQGGALYPGFIEAHGHPLFAAAFAAAVDVAGFRYDSMDKVRAQLRAAVAKAKPGSWVFAFGFDPVLVRDYAPLSRRELDDLAPQNPVFVVEQMMHKGYANSLALAAAGLDENAIAPRGGAFGRNEEGTLNGAIIETPAMGVMVGAMPSVPREGYRQLIAAQFKRFHAQGYTTVVDMGEQAQFSDPYGLMAEIAHDKKTPLRLRFFVAPQVYQHVKDNLKSDPRAALLGVKLWIDGSPYAGGMALAKPYRVSEITKDRLGLTPQSRGALNFTDADLNALVLKLHAAGIQIAMHVQGERAEAQALNAIEAAQKAHPRSDARHRLEHNALITMNQIDRAVADGVSLSFFTNHIRYYGAALRDSIIGPERAKRVMPAGQAALRGALVSIHSDVPASPLDSLAELQTAVLRQSDADGSIVGAKGALTPVQALEAVSINAARQIFAEEEIGSLEEGKRADLVWLSSDPLSLKPEDWRTIHIKQVWIDGVTPQ